jgi:PilZ domain
VIPAQTRHFPILPVRPSDEDQPLRGSIPQGLFQERRKSHRFPVHQALQYRVVKPSTEKVTGVGQILDMSGSGILFSTQGQLRLGRTLEVTMTWPARLDGICRLKFVASGRVVRSEGQLVAMRIQRYEFHTRGSSRS